MSSFTQRNRLLLFGVEATAGVEEALVVGTDAIKTEGLTKNPNFEAIERNEHTGTLDTSEGVVGVGGMGMSGTVHLKGSGTAGTAPEYGTLIRCAGFIETLLAADDTGTAQSGTASTLVLAVAAITSDDEFNGMVIELTGGTGSGQTRIIDDSIASSDTVNVFPDWAVTPDVTSVYAIRASAVYRQTSAGLVTGTAFLYERSSLAGQNPRLSKIIGAVNNLNFTLGGRESPRFDWTMTGILPSLPANVADPGTATFDPGSGPAYRDVEANLGQPVAKFSQLTYDVGNEIAQPDDPTALYGLDIGCVTSRGGSGQINPRGGNLATIDVMSDWLAETTQAFWTTWGSTAGNRMSIYIPRVKYTGVEDADVNGFTHDGAPFEAKAADRSMYLTIF